MDFIENIAHFMQHNWILNSILFLCSIFLFLLFRKFHAKTIKHNIKERMITKTIYLKSEGIKIHEWVKEHVNFLNKNHKNLLETYSPIIIYDDNIKKNNIIFPKTKICQQIEDLFELWEAGYYFPQFILLFAIYLRSRKILEYKKKILSLSTYKDIDEIQKYYLSLYFDEIFLENANTIDKNHPDKKIQQIEITYKNSIYFTEACKLSLELNNPNIKWSRKKFENYISQFFANVNEKEKTTLLSLVCNAIIQKTNSLLKGYIVLKYSQKYNLNTRSYIESIIWKYGSYHRLNLLANPSKVEKLISEFPTKKYKEKEFQEIIQYFTNKPFSYFHTFYFLYSLKNHKDLKHQILIPQEELFKVSEAFLYQFESSPYWPTIHIRWIIFLFHIYKKEWKKSIKIMQYIGYYQDSFFGTLLYNRALFYTDDKEIAYNNIQSMLNEKPDDLILLNEMVLYNYYLGYKSKVKELLSKIKQTTKKDPILIKTEKMML